MLNTPDKVFDEDVATNDPNPPDPLLVYNFTEYGFVLALTGFIL